MLIGQRLTREGSIAPSLEATLTNLQSSLSHAADGTFRPPAAPDSQRPLDCLVSLGLALILCRSVLQSIVAASLESSLSLPPS